MVGIRIVYKSIAFLTLIGAFLIGSFFRRSTPKKQEWVRWVSKVLLSVFGFKIQHRMLTSPTLNEPKLIVSNHVSFWDVLILSQIYQPVFLTSVEVKNDPFLGTLCKNAGCLFIERRDRSRTQMAIDEIALTLKQGNSVALFPEGTSSNGEQVLPFKKSVFQSAITADTPVLPVCINYQKIDHQPMNAFNRESIFYYGDHHFLTQLIRTMKLKSIYVQVVSLPQIAVNENSIYYELSEKAHQSVCSVFETISNLGGSHEELSPPSSYPISTLKISG